MKKITLDVDDITPKQWTTLVLELNIMRKSWRPYGVDIKFLGHGIKKIVEWGNKRNDNSKRTRQDSKSLLEDEEKEV